MNAIIELVTGALLDPIVLTSAATLSALLLTGTVARAIEFTERNRPHRS